MWSLHSYSLKQKLILFAILPILMLGIFGIIRASGLHQDFKTAHNNSLTIKVSGHVGHIISNLQQERALSLKPQNHDDSSAFLSQQQARTDASFNSLLKSADLAKLLKVVDDETQLQLAEHLAKLKTSINQLKLARQQGLGKTTIKETDIFNDLSDNLLHLINLLQGQTNDGEQSRAYADLKLVLRVQELAARERSIIHSLLLEKSLNLESLKQLETLSLEQEHIIALAADTFGDEHRLLLLKMLASLPNQQVETIRKRLQEQRQFSELTQSLVEVIALGSMLHDGNSANLGHQRGDVSALQQQWQDAHLLLNRLNAFCHLNEEQQQALQILSAALANYPIQVTSAAQGSPLSNDFVAMASIPSAANNSIPNANADIVKAIQALKSLPPPIGADNWWELASRRIEMLHNLSHDISKHIADLSRHQMQMALLYITLYSLAAALTLLLSLLIGRKVIASLMHRIKSISTVMQQMADDPSLELTVNIDGTDELGQMAQAMNTMLGHRKTYRQALSRAAAVFKHSAEGIVVTDADNHIELVNPAFTQITGYSLEDVKGRNPSILKSHRNSPLLYSDMWQSLRSTDKWEGEIWNKRKDGQVYPEYLALTLVRDDKGRIVHHIGLFMDISRRKQYEQDIWYKANFDTLTDLPNRKLLSERLHHEIKVAKNDSRKLAVMVLDLDRFKFINDTRGHECGDALLKAVSERLQSLLGPTDFLARIGGDEFVIVLPRIAQELKVEQQALKILQLLEEPFHIDEQTLDLSVSLGIGLYPEDGLDVETLLSNAETALFDAKDSGRNNFKYFTPMMNQAMIERLAMERALRQALLREEFLLHYQPVVNIHTGEVTALEALLRWQSPEKGFISPVKFIALAEDMGLMESIGQWVIDRALNDLSQLHHQGYQLNMAINVSASQCLRAEQCLADKLRVSLQKHRISPRHLHIEITESLLMDDSKQCLSNLNKIRKLGCDIYLDDFGTGYSSLSYLKKFPISVIKIDQSFVKHLPDCESDVSLVRAIIQMGKSLDMKLVAEGVETEAQLACLLALGSDYGQGYLYSRPLPLIELCEWLSTRMGSKSNTKVGSQLDN